MDAHSGKQEAWRWRADTYYLKHQTISVIEPPAKDGEELEDDRPKVPFGFGRVLASAESPEVKEPLLWEGDGA